MSMVSPHIPWFSRCFRKESKKIVTLSGDSDFATIINHPQFFTSINKKNTINGGVQFWTIHYKWWDLTVIFSPQVLRKKHGPWLLGAGLAFQPSPPRRRAEPLPCFLLHGQLMESHGISEKNHEKIGMICVS
jgi:hypothetical protein